MQEGKEGEGEEGAEAQPADKAGDGESGQPEENAKVFEERNSYILLKVTLAHPINPTIDPQILPRSTDIARNAMENMPESFPSVIDAVQDYQNTTYAIVQEISIEYSRMFQGEEENASPLGMAAPASTTVKSQQNIYNNTHMREMREQRREKFLIEFNSSNNYTVQ